MHRGTIVACVILGCLPLTAAAAEKKDDDPWKGKSRSEVIALLGEPAKTKDARQGGEKLVYKFVRLEEGAIPPPGVAVLEVPGIGVVGRLPQAGAMQGGEMEVEPTETDRRGRKRGGGLTREESVSVTWEDGKKRVERTGDDRPAIRGKVTLKLVVGPDGKVESWFVSPRKAMEGQ